MRRLVLLFVLCALAQAGFANPTPNSERYKLAIKRAMDKITIDGKLTEGAWHRAKPARDFWQQFPDDSTRARRTTEVRMTYDKNNLYIAIVAFQKQEYVVQSLRRDFSTGGNNDVVQVNIDTFHDKQNAFQFAVNPYGVQREGLVSNGDNFSSDWDNQWYSQVRTYRDRWIVEIAIPFKTLRYRTDADAMRWGINFFRYNLSDNERSSWAPIPRGFSSSDLAFSGTLAWDRRPPEPGTNIALIPYAALNVQQDNLRDKPTQATPTVGFDAKIGLTPSLNLDLTVNPDFAQAEVDQQVTNLSRFELLFPERRQFFLENADLFGTFGFAKVNPFFSRRIGLARSSVSDQLERNAIHAGLRVSGKLNDRWRVGLLNMQTAEDAALALRTTNFTVATAQYRVFDRSNISAIVVNKLDRTGYNAVAGLDYNLASEDGRWQGKFFGHTLLRNQNRGGQSAFGAQLEYNTKRLHASTQNELIGQQYNPEVGFVQRRGIARTSNKVSYTYFPKGGLKKWLNYISLGPEVDIIHGQQQQQIIDWEAGLYGKIKFQNTASLRFTLARWEYVYLFSAFDPSGLGDASRALPAGSEFRYRQSKFEYQSDARRPFYATVAGRFGQYFNGNLFNLHTTFHYRQQPVALYSLEVNYNRVRLPDGFNDSDLWLIGPRVDLTFTRNIYFSAIAQYNNQINNLNLNARFQWRFRPVSDFFLVYTDNYFTQAETLSETRFAQPFQSKNRALVAKLTYWFSM
jgi:hypothetical protein